MRWGSESECAAGGVPCARTAGRSNSQLQKEGEQPTQLCNLKPSFNMTCAGNCQGLHDTHLPMTAPYHFEALINPLGHALRITTV